MTAWPHIFLLQDATRREALTRHFHGAATDIRADRADRGAPTARASHGLVGGHSTSAERQANV